MSNRKTTFQNINEELRGTICSFLDSSALWAFYRGCCRKNSDKEQLGQCLSSLHSGIVGASSTMESLHYPIHLLDPITRKDGFATWILGQWIPLQSIVLFFPEGTNEAVSERIVDRIIANLISGSYGDLHTFIIKFGNSDVDPNSTLAETIRKTKGIALHRYLFFSTFPSQILFSSSLVLLSCFIAAITTAACAGQLSQLREISIDHEPFDVISTPLPILSTSSHIYALRHHCPLLTTIKGIHCFDIVDCWAFVGLSIVEIAQFTRQPVPAMSDREKEENEVLPPWWSLESIDLRWVDQYVYMCMCMYLYYVHMLHNPALIHTSPSSTPIPCPLPLSDLFDRMHIILYEDALLGFNGEHHISFATFTKVLLMPRTYSVYCTLSYHLTDLTTLVLTLDLKHTLTHDLIHDLTHNLTHAHPYFRNVSSDGHAAVDSPSRPFFEDATNQIARTRFRLVRPANCNRTT